MDNYSRLQSSEFSLQKVNSRKRYFWPGSYSNLLTATTKNSKF